MNKKQIEDAYARLSGDYGEASSAYCHADSDWTVDAVLVRAPHYLIIGDPSRFNLVMARFQSRFETNLCFLEFARLADEGERSLPAMMSPGGLGYNRAVQKSWNLGFSSASNGVTGTFIGGFGERCKPAMLLEGPFIRFYLDIMNEVLDVRIEPAAAS